MLKGRIKEVIVGILSLLIIIEIGYIVKLNILSDHKAEMGDTTEEIQNLVVPLSRKVIVLDAGHGKPSSQMTAEEKSQSGWVQNSSGQWGEWRHYKTGSANENCEGTGCSGRATPAGSCWYPIEATDRNVEPDINLQNAMVAKRHLEARGYTVRLTRTTNDENPSMTKRLSYCYPDNDMTQEPDALAFICIHSNATGGTARGTAYITASGYYDQKWIKNTYADDCNRLGKKINDKIINSSSLGIHGNGEIRFKPELVVFCKAPVTCAYLEIGFFDNASDSEILNTESEDIGKAIAEGVDEFCQQR